LKQFKGYRPEAEVRELIHSSGIKTFPKPNGIPDDFRVKCSRDGAGMKYVHPKTGETNIRVMPGKPHSPFPHQQKPYVVQMKNGEIIDKYGNIVERNSIEAHIPLDEFIYID